MGAVVTFPGRSAPAEIRPSAGPSRLRCLGVSRDADNPQAVAVTFSRPLSDAELRVFHDACRQAAGIVEAAVRSDESQP